MTNFTLFKLLKEIVKTVIALVILLASGRFIYFLLTTDIPVICITILSWVLIVLSFGFGSLYLWASLYGVSDVIAEIKRR